MKAIRIHEYGGPETMRLEELPDPQAPPGHVLVRCEAAGVNFIDTYQRSGLYKVPLPFTVGMEGAGVVVAVGPEVGGLAEGARVAWAGVAGSYATHVLVPAEKAVPVPDGVSTRDAAAAMLQGLTAHYLAHSTWPLRKDEACLIHAGAGGVGLLLTQMAKRARAHAITTVSTGEKAALSREAGADDVILYSREDFAEAARRLRGGRGLQVVYDSVGRDTFDRSLTCLEPRGMMVLYGQSSGPVGPIDPQVLNQRGSLFLTRPKLDDYTRTRAELLFRSEEVLGWIGAGTLRLRIGATFPLAEAARAHQDLQGRRTTGKVLLIP
jgi:NADPH2:quinone reductase